MKKSKGALWIIGFIIGLLALNYLASVTNMGWDLTQGKRYSLTPSSRQLLNNIDQELNINVFLAGDIPSQFRKLSTTTSGFLDLLEEQKPALVHYHFIDPQTEVAPGKTWGDSLRVLGASPINISLQVKAGEESKIVFPYAVVNYNGRSGLVNLFQSSKRNVSAAELNNAEALMEYQFLKEIDRIREPAKPLIAYAVGHNEPTGPNVFSLQQTVDPESLPAELLKVLGNQESSNYKMVIFNLKEQPVIPDTFKVMMIVKPDTAFSDADLLKLDQYVMRGGKILWFIDNLNAEPDSLSIKSKLIAYDRSLNLQDLLFHYGVRINPDLLMDLQCDFLPFAVGGSATNPQYEFLQWNYYPVFESRNNHPINKNLGPVSSRFVNSLDTIELEGIKKTFLLQSSANSRTISTPALISPNENRNTPEDALFKKNGIPAAVLLEGRFTSFFAGRLGKARADSLQRFGGFREQSPEDAKMIVVGDGDIVLNDFSQSGPLAMGMNLYTKDSRYEYPYANREFLLNCLEYLTSRGNLTAARNKEIVLRLLDPSKSEKEKTRWQLINIAIPIVIVILAAFIFQAIRRRRYA